MLPPPAQSIANPWPKLCNHSILGSIPLVFHYNCKCMNTARFIYVTMVCSFSADLEVCGYYQLQNLKSVWQSKQQNMVAVPVLGIRLTQAHICSSNLTASYNLLSVVGSHIPTPSSSWMSLSAPLSARYPTTS